MKGLLIKDLRILKSMKTQAILIVICGCGMTITNTTATVGLGFLMLIGMMLSVSTINYDEYDNGGAFLYTLPFTRVQYVLEKYLLGIVMSIVFGLLGVVILSLLAAADPSRELLPWSVVLVMECVMCCLGGVYLPIQMKFGGEKARYVLVAVYAAIMIGLLELSDRMEHMEEGFRPGWILRLSSGEVSLLGLVFVATIVILVISLNVSIRIVKQKEW